MFTASTVVLARSSHDTMLPCVNGLPALYGPMMATFHVESGIRIFCSPRLCLIQRGVAHVA
ncbi:hypothetical protein [Gemmatimonas sp.]|uniref:hypothetical protein n=1 Tax=Gemmatimonas sp. TaxID=1962908 RepID=UPI003568D4A1